jgi:hypothetical protein
VLSSADPLASVQGIRREACNGSCVWDTTPLCVAGPAGQRVTITVKIDPAGAVNETNEGNNVCRVTLPADATRRAFPCP